jgi:hypothetical protein
MIFVLKFILLLVLYVKSSQTIVFKESYDDVAANGSYTCDDLTRWVGTEKHYSNEKKAPLFTFLRGMNCKNNQYPVVFFDNISYGWSQSGKRLFFPPEKQSACNSDRDPYVVVYLSNYSINNNFSHFLHGLLRLFCALIDSRWLIWDHNVHNFVPSVNYTIWLDEYLRITPEKAVWLSALGSSFRMLNEVEKGQCVSAEKTLYGSGCLKLLPPEKWFGYPGCRAGKVLPAFGHYMRRRFMGQSSKDLVLLDEHGSSRIDPGLRVAFAVRDVSAITGRRVVSNLHEIQVKLKRSQHIRTSTENVTFEHLDVPSTVRYMAGVHIFVSVHGAGMTNMFFMNPGTAVVEIIPYPLCHCKSPDYFYGIGGYYHGSAVAQGIKHYHYCVPPEDTNWYRVPEKLSSHMQCSWKLLHAVDSVRLDPALFLSLMRQVERDLIATEMIQLTKPIIHMSPHANG